MYGDQLRYHLLVDLVIMLLLLMMQLEKLGFIALKKNDVFDTFKKWKDLVENETGKGLKCLRSDNGGEYCNNEFDDYCSYHEIRREKIVPRTPQENGV